MATAFLAIIATAAFLAVLVSLFRARDLGVTPELRAFEDEEQMRAIRTTGATRPSGRLTATQS